MQKKMMSVLVASMLMLSITGLVYADEIITISGNIYAKMSIPNSVDFGDLLIGEQTDKKTLFSIDSDPTGAVFNLTLLNGTDNAIFNVIAPPPYSTVTRLDPDTNMVFEAKQGNYTIEVISKKVGALSYVVKLQFNESQFNYTKY